MNLLGLALRPTWSVVENAPCIFEKKVYSAVVQKIVFGLVGLQYSKPSIFLLIFSMNQLLSSLIFLYVFLFCFYLVSNLSYIISSLFKILYTSWIACHPCTRAMYVVSLLCIISILVYVLPKQALLFFLKYTLLLTSLGGSLNNWFLWFSS